MVNDVVRTDSQVPAYLVSGSGRTGFENIDSDVLALPFLKLAQQMTPQAQKKGGDYIEGVEPGVYFNPSTRKVYGDSFKVVILGFYQQFTEWEGDPPQSRFVGAHSKMDFERNIAPEAKMTENGLMYNGHRIVDTRNFILMPYENPEDGVLIYSMSSSGIPASKKWLASASAVRIKTAEGRIEHAPIWSRVWELHTSMINGDKGNYFQLTDWKDCGWVPVDEAEIFKAAFDEYQSIERSKIVEAGTGDMPNF